MAVKIIQLTQKTDLVQHDPIFQHKMCSHLNYGINVQFSCSCFYLVYKILKP